MVMTSDLVHGKCGLTARANHNIPTNNNNNNNPVNSVNSVTLNGLEMKEKSLMCVCMRAC